jgi:hypothetical protein
VLEILACGQLAVGHVDEVVAAEKLPEIIDVAAVDGVVGAIAAVDLMRQGDGAVGRNVEAEDQLFEVRPMILVVMWLATLCRAFLARRRGAQVLR